MSVALITHVACLAHEVPAGHPERPARLEAVLEGLKTQEFQSLVRLHAGKSSRESLLRVHDGAHVDAVFRAAEAASSAGGFVQIDADTVVSPGSAEAALRAAGAVIDAADLVMRKKCQSAFCAVRPPGHHAPRGRAMGFCLFNNVAIGALHVRSAYGLNRIAVVDFDVHHGNGTQEIFWNDANLFYASTHQSPLYPGTGNASETGISGNIVNMPLEPFSDGAAFRAAYEGTIFPALEAFAPEFLFISAGFDAHKSDPLAQMNLDEDDFAWVTRRLCGIAAKVCNGRIVSTLEGGYDLDALANSAAAHLRALAEGPRCFGT